MAIGGGMVVWTARSTDARGELAPLVALSPGDIVPVIVGDFDIRVFGSENPRGIAYNTLTREYAVVDNFAFEVYIANTDGVLMSQFDTLAFGSDNPQGIAYNSLTDRYAIVDDTDDEVYIVDTSGTLINQCNTAGIAGALTGDNVTGIAYNSATNTYAITENGDAEVYIIDATIVGGDCTLTSQFDTGTLGAPAATNPQGITYNSANDTYEITDSSTDDVYVVNANPVGLGTLIDQFDTLSSGMDSPLGVAYNPHDRLSAISDSFSRDVVPVDYRGTLVSQFDIAGPPVLSSTPSGVTFLPALGQLAITDYLGSEIHRVDQLGAFINNCDIGGLGINFPAGIAYLPATDEYAVVDDSADEVFFLDASDPLCALSVPDSGFETFTLGAQRPTDIALNISTGELLVTDSDDQALSIMDIDPMGKLNGQFSTAAFGFFPLLGSGFPQGVAYLPNAGMFAIVDPNDDEVHGMNSFGLSEWHFDTAILGATNTEGITLNPDTGEVFLVDSATDEIYVLDLPRILEPTTITGTFFSAAVGITLELEETGDGFFSGFAAVGGGASPTTMFGASIQSHAAGIDLSGFFNSQNSDFTMTVLTTPPTGILVSGSVSDDLKTINLGAISFLRQ